MSNGTILRPSSARKVALLIARGSDLSTSRKATLGARQISYLRITGAFDEGDGVYPCEILTPKDGVFIVEEAETVAWSANDDHDIEVGTILLGLRDGDDTGGRVRFVIDDGGGAGNGEEVHWVKAETDDAEGPGQIQTWDGSAWVDTTECRLKIREGTRFVTGRVYLATKNGTITEGEGEEAVEFPLLHATGHNENVLTFCDGDAEVCKKWIVPAPWIIEDVDCEEV